MKASELRIGNFVNADNLAKISLDFGNYFIVERLHKYNDYIGLKSPMFENFIWSDVVNTRPIPLTEEWLVRFGFKDNEYTFDLHSGRKTITFNWSSRIISTGYRSGLYCKKYRHIQYVHQLQNLYFALTGEELTYTP